MVKKLVSDMQSAINRYNIKFNEEEFNGQGLSPEEFIKIKNLENSALWIYNSFLTILIWQSVMNLLNNSIISHYKYNLMSRSQ